MCLIFLVVLCGLPKRQKVYIPFGEWLGFDLDCYP